MGNSNRSNYITPQINEWTIIESQIPKNKENARIKEEYLANLKNELLNLGKVKLDILYKILFGDMDGVRLNEYINRWIGLEKYFNAGVTIEDLIYTISNLYGEQYIDNEDKQLISKDQINFNTIIITDINNQLLDLMKNGNPYTPQINELKIDGYNINSINVDSYNRIINLNLQHGYYLSHMLNEDYFNDFAIFFNSDNISLEEKKQIGKYLSEENKIQILKAYLYLYLKYSKDVNNGYYRPKYNNIPIHSIVFIEQIIDILTGKKQIKNTEDIIYLKTFIDNSTFFEGNHLPTQASLYKTLLSQQNYIDAYNQWFYKKDQEKIEETKNNNVVHSFNINNQIKSYILSDIPKDFTQLEKAIYIYSKLCTILDYDLNYYKKVNESFLDEAEIENVDLNNNNVVCYTFSYILAGLLREIGITNIHEKEIVNNKFDKYHANIEFLVDDIVVFADSTINAATGDLTVLKFDNKIKGIRCSQFELRKQQLVENAKNKISDIMKLEIDKKEKIMPTDIEIDNMSEYEKYVYFNNIVANAPKLSFNGVALLGYLYMLKEKLKIHVNISLPVQEKDFCINIKINPFGFKDYLKKFNLSYKLDLNEKTVDYISTMDKNIKK